MVISGMGCEGDRYKTSVGRIGTIPGVVNLEMMSS